MHGYNDYFFQRGLAEHFAARGYRFYAVDLRKCGRSRREWLTPHYSSDFAQYAADIRAALGVIGAELGPAFPDNAVATLVHGHSTGGLIAPLAVARERRDPDSIVSRLVRGLVLNSPFVELPAPVPLRLVATGLAAVVGKAAPTLTLPQSGFGAYGESLHSDYRGEWDYNLARKPLLGPPLRLGWLRAVTRAQRAWRQGLDVGVPALVLHSDRSYLSGSAPDKIDSSDAVLDVAHIKRWAGFITPNTAIAQIRHARHDVFLSLAEARERAYAALDQWLDEREQAWP